jgi:hypothetical protein
MTYGLVMAHSGWRYIIILVLAVALIRFAIALVGSRKWSKLDETLLRITPIVIDIQLLLGVVVWVLQQRWNGAIPLVSWEHPVTMLIVVLVAHTTSSRVKRLTDDAAKFRLALIGYGVTSVILALGIARITYVL